MRWRTRLFPLLVPYALFCALFCWPVHADEIRLKDGSKIIGTIVGYEDDSFRVQTAYGFALVRKASVQEIVPGDQSKLTEPPQAPATAAGPSDQAKLADSATPKTAKAVAQPQMSSAGGSSSGKSAATHGARPSDSGNASTKVAPEVDALAPPAPDALLTPTSFAPAPGAAMSMPPPLNGKPVSEAAANKPPLIQAEAVTPKALSPSATGVPVAAPPAPAPPPPPAPMKESVAGNLYTNQTYGFSIYRPPDWSIISDSRAAIPGAITALGNDDHSSLLVIGRDLEGGEIDARAASTEHRLRDIYENYRPLRTQHITVAGLPAIEEQFSGEAGGHVWSVTAVTVARGSEVFTILGMTYANSDLIQFQESLVSKVVGSLQFTGPQ